ncbi:MAG: amino acid adenylation domain-containing protein, partial [Bacteroidota bacterium]
MSELLQSIAEEYWIKKLQYRKPLSLFYDHPTSQNAGDASQEVHIAFPPTQADRLAAVAGSAQASVYLILLSVVHALVYKYTGEPDVLVATAGFQVREEEEQALVFFRTVLNETTTPKELLKKNLVQLNTILEHPALSTETLQERFGSEEEQGTLHQLGFYYDGFNRPTSCLSDVQLLFRVTTTDTGYVLGIRFQPAFYSKGQVQQLGEHFLGLLSSFLNRSSQPLSSFHWLSSAEEERVLATERHHLAQASQQTLVALLEAQVARFPEKEALRFKGVSYTYQQLNTQVNSLACYLQKQHQVQPNEVVGLMVPRSSAMVIAILGILKAGAAFLPIESSLPAKRKQYMLENASVKLLLTESDAMFELADYYTGELMALDIQLADLPVVEANPAPGSGPSDLAYVLYTSGSTGEPKGVEIQHQSIVNYVQWANQHYFQHETGHRFALFTAITFDLTLTSLFSSLLRGDGLLVTEEKPIDELLRELFGSQSTVRALKLTPAHINLLGELGLQSTPIQTVILGGEALHQKQIDILLALNPAMQIFNEYGPTEAAVGCMVKQVGGNEAEITIGKAIEHTSIYIIDAHHVLLPSGVAGEIGVSGAGLAKGYLNQPDTTAEKFVSIRLNQAEETFRLYKTGDLGLVLPNGEIRYLGRKDNQVKIRAFRVELGEIENCLRKHPAIKETVVLDAEDKAQDKFLVAYYIAEEVLLVEELRHHVGAYLPEYMIPAYFVRVEKFPLTAHGKIDRKALPSPMEALSGRPTYVAPTNVMEANLVRVWEEALDVKEVGIHDNFFGLGGDSLKAIRVANKIQQLVGETVPFTLLFDAPTIQRFAACLSVSVQQRLETITDLASFVDGKKGQPGLADFAIEPIAEADHYEVSHAQGRIWLTAQMEEKQIGYNICGARVLPDIQRASLERALQALVERHESLRTVFINLDGRPKQKILPPDARFKPEYLDLREDDHKQEKVNA